MKRGPGRPDVAGFVAGKLDAHFVGGGRGGRWRSGRQSGYVGGDRDRGSVIGPWERTGVRSDVGLIEERFSTGASKHQKQ